MNLLKTSFLSGIATLIKMASNLIINKIIAIYIGPSGIALIGQFQNILNSLVTLGSGGISSGITKYISEYNGDIKKRNQFIQSSLVITICCSLLIGVLIFIFQEWLAVYSLSNVNYKGIFVVLSVNLLFISLNTYLLALLNGLKEIKIYIGANILGSIISLVLSTFLTIFYGLYGALIALILVQSIVVIVTGFYFYKKKVIGDFNWEFAYSKVIYKKFFQYSLMSLTTMLCVPITQLVIRNMIIEKVSLQYAGYWEAMNRISSMYLLVVTTALTTYYLPRLSEIKKVKELKEEIRKSYRLVLPFVFISCVLIYYMKDIIISILFTKEFYEMRDLFLYQLIGDFFKMASWILGFLMIAKAMTKTFIITEIISSVIYISSSHIYIYYFPEIGATIAYTTTYVVYFFLMVIIYKKIILKNFLKVGINN
ncbi:O-antigen translocase [Bacillus mycoides]|uniref:O-antigen translocase n=1 Tax=Bacillus mycoides TaxID=1405 RepID=UPI001C0299C0|nr:O-antigen translocase [Bacillus mycoides]QWI52124.1 O-antigen translocase [Bacillus mycoides]